MTAGVYPFLDIAVLDPVREGFARGELQAVLSADLADIVWANGAGARLFGHDSIEDAIGAPSGLSPQACRQVASLRGFPAVGQRRPVMVRMAQGPGTAMIALLASAVRMPGGEAAILLSAPAEALGATDPATTAAAAIAGFGGIGEHAAIIDADGSIAAATPEFGSLGVSLDTILSLIGEVAAEDDRLVKRLIRTASGMIPAGFARLSDVPARHLLLAIDPSAAAELPEEAVAAPVVEETADETVTTPLASEPADTDQAEAIESDDEPVETEAGDLPDAARAPSPLSGPQAKTGLAVRGARINVDETAAPRTPANDRPDDWYFGGKADKPAREPTSAPAPEKHGGPAEQFGSTGEAEPAGKQEPGLPHGVDPVRFVWRTDAEGRFSSISPEFAEAVGPNSADIIGRRFAEVATILGMDPDGDIAGLLQRRDTWSGRSVLWPVQGTQKRAPVDLAALPVYDRERRFEGFRGFGVVRLGELSEDPEKLGLALAGGDVIHDEGTPVLPGISEDAGLVEDQDRDGDALLPDPFEGETPAIEVAPTEGRRWNDKVISLAEHRERPAERSLSPSEKIAFRSIGEQLKEESGEAGEPEPNDAEPVAVTSDNLADTADETASVIVGEVDADQCVDHSAWSEAQRLRDLVLARFRPTETAVELPGDADDLMPGREMPVAEAAANGAIEAVAEDEASATPIAATSVEMGTNATDAEKTDIRPGAELGSHLVANGVTPTVLARLPLPVLVATGGRLAFANRPFLSLCGRDNLAELEEAGGLAALFGDPVEDGAAGDSQLLALNTADGRTIPVRAHMQSVAWRDGKALLLAFQKAEIAETGAGKPEPGASRDLPFEKEELQRMVRQLTTILDTATDGVVLIDNDGNVRTLNRSAEALFGFESAEIDGKPFMHLFAIESQRQAQDYLAGIAENGVASVLNDGREVIGREAKGRFIPLFMTIGRLPANGGYCAVLRDITQWKRTEEELTSARRRAEAASSQKTDFLARVSHEIRTPLNAIIGFSELMLGERFGPIGNQRYLDYLRDINRSGNHVLDLVNDLLDISKIEAGQQDLNSEAVALNDILDETVALMQPQANRERVIIRSSLPSGLPDVVADTRSVKQIALNLLSNAVKFTPAGGQVIVSTAYEPTGEVVMRVRDTGVGMTPSEIEQALKPFKQLQTSGRRRGEGTGLGLPLTKAMVEANRAHFSIASTPSEGTIVEVTFPPQRVLAD